MSCAYCKSISEFSNDSFGTRPKRRGLPLPGFRQQNSSFIPSRDHDRSSWFLSLEKSYSGTDFLTLLSTMKKDAPPQRIILFIDAARKAITECLSLTEQDMITIQSCVDEPSLFLDQGAWAKNYINKLTFRLTELEKIKEEYNDRLILKTGIYSKPITLNEALGHEHSQSFNNLRQPLLELAETVHEFQEKVGSVLGSLIVEIKGLQGFARMCNGDVFEITMRHGNQKWTTKGKIGQDGLQNWDSSKFKFQVLIGYLFCSRIFELRSFGKQVYVGKAHFETLNLLSAQPQLVTVNVSSSLKLGFLFTWDPLSDHGSQYILKAKNGSPIKSVKSNVSIQDHNSQEYSSKTIVSFKADTIELLLSSSSIESPASYKETIKRSVSADLKESVMNSDIVKSDIPLFNKRKLFCRSSEKLDDASKAMSSSSYETDENTERFKNYSRRKMINARSDISGNFLLGHRKHSFQNYPNNTLSSSSSSLFELHSRKANTDEIGFYDQGHNDPSLHLKDEPEGLSTKNKNKVELDAYKYSDDNFKETSNFPTDNILSLETTLDSINTTISDIQGLFPELDLFERSVSSISLYLEHIRQQKGTIGPLNMVEKNIMECFDFLENEEVEKDIISRPINTDIETNFEQYSIIKVQLGDALLVHLINCKHLLNLLGNYGPLKTRERQACQALQIQGRVLAKFHNLMEKIILNPSYLISANEELSGLPHLQKMWSIVCPKNQSFSVPSGDAYVRLLPFCKENFPTVSSDLQEKVLQLLITRCQDTVINDMKKFNPQRHVTVFQFRYFIRSKERSFQTRFEEIKEEIETVDALFSQDYFNEISRMSLTFTIPCKNVLLKMSQMLLNKSNDPTSPCMMVTSYLLSVCKEQYLYKKLVDSYIEGLESIEHADRQGSCCAIGILKIYQAKELLAHISQFDQCSDVRKQAEVTLQLLFEDVETLKQLQLSRYGFQGISFK